MNGNESPMPVVYVVLENAPNGDLYAPWAINNLSEGMVQYIAKEIMAGINYMKSKGLSTRLESWKHLLRLPVQAQDH